MQEMIYKEKRYSSNKIRKIWIQISRYLLNLAFFLNIIYQMMI